MIQKRVWETDLWEILMNPDSFSVRLERYMEKEGRVYEKMSLHCRESYLTVICNIFMNSALKKEYSSIYKKWEELYKVNKSELLLKYKSNVPTKRQMKEYVSWDTLIKVRDSLPKGSEERLLLLMYTDVPPRRLEYNRLYIGSEVGKNYVLKEGERYKMVLGDYKTVKTYGVYTCYLLESVSSELLNRENRYMFGGLEGYSRGAYGRWVSGVLYKLFDRNMSVSSLRHIYISREDLCLHNRSEMEREVLSSSMGHSVCMQGRYSWHSWLSVNKK